MFDFSTAEWAYAYEWHGPASLHCSNIYNSYVTITIIDCHLWNVIIIINMNLIKTCLIIGKHASYEYNYNYDMSGNVYTACS